MLHLALESSTRTTSICILNGGSPISLQSIQGAQTTSSLIVPEIASALKTANVRPQEIGLVSVSVGPGSFTGLRIGVMLAKTLAYAVQGAALVGVDTHEVIARQGVAQLDEQDKFYSSRIVTVINAQRGQWFVAVFERDQGLLRQISENEIVSPQEFAIQAVGPCWLCGPGLSVLSKDTLENWANFRLCSPETWEPNALTVAQIGWNRYQRGETADLWRLYPVYGRSSAAEEVLKKRGEELL